MSYGALLGNNDEQNGIDSSFDLGQGISLNSTPPEVLTLIKVFNRCYHAGHNAMVTVMVFLLIVLSPFIGMVGGLCWVFIRVMVLPILQPFGDIMRILWGQEGSVWIEVQKMKIRELNRRLSAPVQPVAPNSATEVV